MRVLLTGSTGFLGRVIAEDLASLDLFTLNRKSGDYKFDLVSEIPQFDKSFDLVIHNAGFAHFKGRSFPMNCDFFNVNVTGTLNLLQGLSICCPRQFLYISSVAVYGLENGFDINESYPLQAKDPYGVSKIMAERLVRDWCKQHNVKCTILRLPLIYYTDPPGNLKEMINAIRLGYYFNVKGGLARRSIVYAKDISMSIVKIAQIGGVYNLTDRIHPSYHDLSMGISIQFGKRKPYNLPFWIAKLIAYLGDLLGERFPIDSARLKKLTLDLTFDDSKANQAFGWSPKPVLNYINNVK